MALKRKWIFLLAIITALIIGIAFASGRMNDKGNSGLNSDAGGPQSSSDKFEIVNVWSHDGSPISPEPPTPPEKDYFLPNENIYVVIKTTGIGSKTVRIYIVDNDQWQNGTPLNDVSNDGYNIVTINATRNPQYHGPFLIWSAPLKIGQYDIVVDENLNGIRDPGEKVDESEVVPGVFVIQDFPLGTLMALISSFAALAVFSKHINTK